MYLFVYLYPFQVRWQTNLPNKSKLLIVTHNTEKIKQLHLLGVCKFGKRKSDSFRVCCSLILRLYWFFLGPRINLLIMFSATLLKFLSFSETPVIVLQFRPGYCSKLSICHSNASVIDGKKTFYENIVHMRLEWVGLIWWTPCFWWHCFRKRFTWSILFAYFLVTLIIS